MPIERGREHPWTNYHRRAINPPLREVAPHVLPGLRVEGPHLLVATANDHELVRHGGGGEERLLAARRLKRPGDLALLPIDAEHLVAHRAHVEPVAGNRRRGARLPAQLDGGDL